MPGWPIIADDKTGTDGTPSAFIATALEVLLTYAGILLYIWHWQYSHSWAWVVILAIVLVSHLVRRETPQELGLAPTGLRSIPDALLLVAVAVFTLAVLVGVISRHLLLLPPVWPALRWFLRYAFWSAMQQYLTQSYFHRRLMILIANRHLSSILTAIMFSAAHLPNPVLTVVTLVWGYVSSEFYARYRNIWPLVLIHVAGGSLVGALFPVGLIHNMRVGPGYWFFGLR